MYKIRTVGVMETPLVVLLRLLNRPIPRRL